MAAGFLAAERIARRTFVHTLGSVVLRVGIAVVVGVFIAGITVPVHRDGVDCAPTIRSQDAGMASVSVAYPPGALIQSSSARVVDDCQAGFQYRALALGATGALGGVIALHGINLLARRRPRPR